MTQSGPLSLDDVTAVLHEQAPRLREGELEAAKLRVLARAPKGPAMRSRLAVTAALVVGLLMSLSGVALGISGISASGSAGTAEYTVPGSSQVPEGEQLPGSTPGTTSTPSISQPQTRQAVPAQVSPGEQASASPIREIPFTGFLAIPVLLIGVALLASGAILRARVARA